MWNVPVTLVEARVGDAWVSGRVREGVLASSEVFGDTRPFLVIDKETAEYRVGKCCCDYKAGINAASQEALSMALGAK